MTCYFRHMKDVFSRAGIEINKENKKDIDRAIHSYVGIEYKDCSSTWKEVKKKLDEDDAAFIKMLESIPGI